MKTPTCLLAAVLALGTSGQLVAQDSKAPKNDPHPAAKISTNKPAFLDPLKGAPTDRSATSGPALFTSTLSLHDLGISSNAVVISSGSARQDVIKANRLRLEGSMVPVVKHPAVVTFLQLFNPFAPAEYGSHATSAAQGFGRIFADPIKTGPTTVLFSVGANPPKPGTAVKSSSY